MLRTIQYCKTTVRQQNVLSTLQKIGFGFVRGTGTEFSGMRKCHEPAWVSLTIHYFYSIFVILDLIGPYCRSCKNRSTWAMLSVRDMAIGEVRGSWIQYHLFTPRKSEIRIRSTKDKVRGLIFMTFFPAYYRALSNLISFKDIHMSIASLSFHINLTKHSNLVHNSNNNK